MTVDAGRIKLVGHSFVRSLGHYDVNEIQHRARQLCTSFTPAHHPPAPCLPTHLHWPSTCSACPAVHLPPPPPSPSPTTANVGSFAWRPRATPSPFSAFHLLPLYFPFLLPPFSLLHLSGCTFRFNFVAIMHAKVQCFVGILFTQPPPTASAPACWHFIACFIQQRFVCLAHSLSHSATVKMKCAKCTLSTAFINILVLVGVNTI